MDLEISIPASENAQLASDVIECCVCHMEDNLIKTTCNHAIHVSCLLQWTERQIKNRAAVTCPICRLELLPAPAQQNVPIQHITSARFIHTGHNQRNHGHGHTNHRNNGQQQQPQIIQPLLTQQVTEELDNMVELLIRNVHHGSPLDNMIEAIVNDDQQTALRLIAQNPQIVNSRRDDETVPLHLAVYRQQIEILDILLSKSANPRLHDKFGITPLHVAVTVGNLDCARRLLGAGANVESADNCGDTPLHYAVRAKDVAMVSLLVRKRADVNAKNNMGNTVFHLLANGDYPHNITSILKHTAPTCLSSTNYIGDTPLHIAVEQCNTNFIKKFKEFIPFHTRFISNHVGLVAEDYIEELDTRFTPIRSIFSQWQRPEHGAVESNESSSESNNTNSSADTPAELSFDLVIEEGDSLTLSGNETLIIP